MSRSPTMRDRRSGSTFPSDACAQTVNTGQRRAESLSTIPDRRAHARPRRRREGMCHWARQRTQPETPREADDLQTGPRIAMARRLRHVVHAQRADVERHHGTLGPDPQPSSSLFAARPGGMPARPPLAGARRRLHRLLRRRSPPAAAFRPTPAPGHHDLWRSRPRLCQARFARTMGPPAPLPASLTRGSSAAAVAGHASCRSRARCGSARPAPAVG